MKAMRLAPWPEPLASGPRQGCNGDTPPSSPCPLGRPRHAPAARVRSRLHIFSTIIPRTIVIPVTRSKLYCASFDNQRYVRVEVSQGENVDARANVLLGSFEVEGLPAKPAGEVMIAVRFSLDLNGILTVTAAETSTGLQQRLVVNNANTHRLASHGLEQSRGTVETLFSSLSEPLENES